MEFIDYQGNKIDESWYSNSIAKCLAVQNKRGLGENYLKFSFKVLLDDKIVHSDAMDLDLAEIPYGKVRINIIDRDTKLEIFSNLFETDSLLEEVFEQFMVTAHGGVMCRLTLSDGENSVDNYILHGKNCPQYSIMKMLKSSKRAEATDR